MSTSSNSTPLLREYLELVKELSPLEERAEYLKTQIRAIGPGEYVVPKLGVVKVSQPSDKKIKGTELTLNLAAFTKLPVKEQSTLQSKGIVKLENVWSQARSSSVAAVLA